MFKKILSRNPEGWGNSGHTATRIVYLVLSQTWLGHLQPCKLLLCYFHFRGGSSMASEERFHGGHFPKHIVLQAVFWYLRYSLSYRDIEELMRERGVEIDHATVQRWVVKYTPILEEEFRKRKKTVGTSWRMDETYIKVKGIWHYLYRAVDKEGTPSTSCWPESEIKKQPNDSWSKPL